MQSLRSRALYNFFKYIGSPFDVSSPLAKQRAYIERQAKFARMPSKVDVNSVSIDGMYAEWLTPREVRKDRAVLYLHGGGYTMGSCITHRSLASWIALASQSPALLVDYRLAPENPFPAALDDTLATYRWLLKQGIEGRRIAMAGDSAGGGLAVAAAAVLRDGGERLPAGIVCISPWADLSLSGETMSSCAETDPLISLETSRLHAERYVGGQDPSSPLISPIFADLSDLPPLFIQVGEHETLRSDSERLAENARQAGVEVTIEIWEGMFHVWHAYVGFMPEAKQAIDDIGLFVKDRFDTQ